jgi:hypothetical protein
MYSRLSWHIILISQLQGIVDSVDTLSWLANYNIQSIDSLFWLANYNAQSIELTHYWLANYNVQSIELTNYPD